MWFYNRSSILVLPLLNTYHAYKMCLLDDFGD